MHLNGWCCSSSPASHWCKMERCQMWGFSNVSIIQKRHWGHEQSCLHGICTALQCLQSQCEEWWSRKNSPVLHGILWQCVDTVELPGGSAVDHTIEQTISRFAKTAGDVVGLRHCQNLFAVWCQFVSCNGWSIAELFHIAPMLDIGGILSQF